jgi:hypothetical protein
VVSEIVGCRAGHTVHKTVENGSEFSTGVEDTPTISWVLALSGTRYIVVELSTSRRSTRSISRAFFEVFGIPLGKWRLVGPRNVE